MVKTALVATELAIGERSAEIFDSSDLAISVATWLYPQEYEDWRYVLAPRRLDAVGEFEAYRLVHDTIENAGIAYVQTPALMIMKMNDPFIRALRRSFGKTKSVEGMRLGGQMVGNRFVEDAFIYRIR